MRLKRSEYEYLQEIVKKHTIELLLIRYNKFLECYWLEIKGNLYSDCFEIINYDWEHITTLCWLQRFDDWFNWYVQWFEYMETIKERDEYFEEQNKENAKQVLNSKKK